MKKILILTLAVLSFAACDQAAKPAPEANQPAVQVKQQVPAQQVQQPAPQQQAAKKPVAPVQTAQAKKKEQKNYVLPGLSTANYHFTEKINKKPVVVAFMAGFCGWCKRMLPYMDELAGSVPNTKADVIIAFMDEDPNGLKNLEPVKNARNINIYYNAAELMHEQGVNSFPTIILFKDGEKVQTWRGYSPDHVESILKTLKNLK